MSYVGVSKPYKEQFIEADINKLKISDKQLDTIRKGLIIDDKKYPCTIEGVRVGYGVRMFFICEHCSSRVAKLYVTDDGKSLKCRHCIGFNYLSQQVCKTGLDYEFHLMRKIGRLVDPKFNLENGLDTRFPYRPKRMHYKTYEKIRDEYFRIQRKGHLKWLNMIKL